jgi:hypothetical protein
LIQRTRHLDSIVAHTLFVADFIDSIGQLLASKLHYSLQPAAVVDAEQPLQSGGRDRTVHAANLGRTKALR